ncbi:hypothetical protein LSG31_13155 [Fodinisporobacter ferrooxydans]|uniref:Uncharacterized protein n=1 Tax=Fodinisporobacter ferrooxydans TaxID=2901836 RepID=A0ABY4CEF0_9BACL|nr:hypothetical protein LSG31_13155 [Alicyclobacillaceae bacterium MYW30-H2]
MKQIKIQAATASASFVMALGILIVGAFQQISFLKFAVGHIATLVLLFFLLGLFACYTRDAIRGVMRTKHFEHPIQSFAIGTWIAATSVTILAILKELPMLKAISLLLFGLNIGLITIYLVQIIRNYIHLFWRESLRTRLERINGIILLACVAVQSIVIAGENLFQNSLPLWIAKLLILLGICFYAVGFLFIISRYVMYHKKEVFLHWDNTNCIIHGAMSITGLACVTSKAFSQDVAAGIWLWVLFCFLIVESFEIIRAIVRIKRYGVKQGILVYSVSQWSRNFTFGMFLAFTIHLSLKESFLQNPVFAIVRMNILHAASYLVLLLFVIETFIFATHIVTRWKSYHQRVSVAA